MQGLTYVSSMFYGRPLLCFTVDVPALGEFVGVGGGVGGGEGHRMLRECEKVQTLYYDEEHGTRTAAIGTAQETETLSTTTAIVKSKPQESQ